MKITFLVPELNLTGGLRVIAIYAQLLSAKGHKVTVVSPGKRLPSFKQRIKAVLKWKGYTYQSGFNDSFFKERSYQLQMLETCRPITAADVPDGDIIIATFWSTAEWISNFPESKGKKAYFIQHFETHSWLPIDKVSNTFRLPYKKVVVAQWIADEIKIKADITEEITVVPNGVDTKKFHALNRKKQSVPTVGLMYSTRTYKGCATAFLAIAKARELYPSLKVVAFGTDMPSEELALPDNTDYIQQPDQSELVNLYNSCDAWLFTSNSEGFGLPILEAMACGTPVIGTKCGAAPDLITPDSGYLCDIDDVDAISAAIISMCDMQSEEWRGYSNAALSIAQQHTWEDAVNKFEEAIV